MKYIMAKHPAIAWPLIPWFVEGTQTVQEIFTDLYTRLSTEPDKVFCEIALENEKCKAVLIAYETPECVWIWQARASRGFKNSRKMFDDLKKWAKAKDKKTMKLSTNNPKMEKIYSRRYGFEKNGDCMEKAI